MCLANPQGQGKGPSFKQQATSLPQSCGTAAAKQKGKK